MTTLRLFTRFFTGSVRLVLRGNRHVLGVAGRARRADRLRRAGLRPPAAARARRHGHARPGELGLLHRQLHVPGRRRRRGGRARDPRLRLRLEADPADRRLRRAAGRERDRDVPAVRVRGHRPARPLLAPAAALRAPQLPELDPGLGRAGAEPLLRRELHGGDAHPLPRVHRTALREAVRRPARAAVDPDGGRHPHRDGLPVQRAGGAARTGTRRSSRRSSSPRPSARARRSC